jgi:hypothetical protein
MAKRKYKRKKKTRRFFKKSLKYKKRKFEFKVDAFLKKKPFAKKFKFARKLVKRKKSFKWIFPIIPQDFTLKLAKFKKAMRNKYPAYYYKQFRFLYNKKLTTKRWKFKIITIKTNRNPKYLRAKKANGRRYYFKRKIQHKKILVFLKTYFSRFLRKALRFSFGFFSKALWKIFI